MAVGSDARTPLTDAVVEALGRRGIRVELHGALAPGHDPRWPVVAEEVARRVARGDTDQGLLFCWTGTGVSIAANKVPGARAALCTDAPTASGARRWNDANILCLSLRLTSPEVAAEVLDAWLQAEPDPSERENVERLKALDAQHGGADPAGRPVHAPGEEDGGARGHAQRTVR